MNEKYLKLASFLALVTIFYNIAEGVVSVWFGAEDGAFSLFGFGLDSFVEVISGVGVWHMVGRMKASGGEGKDEFEKAALKVTGGAFYVLAAGLTATAAVGIYQGHRPATTFWGIIISSVSIASMWLLIHYKVKAGRALNSDAILADAACTRTCLRLSVVLLLASVGYELTGIGYFDSAGTLLIAWLSVGEGKEAFGKAKGLACSCGGKCHAEAKPVRIKF